MRGLNHVTSFIYLQKDSECDVHSTSIRNCKYIANTHPVIYLAYESKSLDTPSKYYIWITLASKLVTLIGADVIIFHKHRAVLMLQTKTRVINTPTNEKAHRQYSEPIKTRNYYVKGKQSVLGKRM